MERRRPVKSGSRFICLFQPHFRTQNRFALLREML